MVLFLRCGDEEVLLRNLASVYFHKKAYLDSRNCKLYCFVLEISPTFSVFFQPLSFGRLFHALQTH